MIYICGIPTRSDTRKNPVKLGRSAVNYGLPPFFTLREEWMKTDIPFRELRSVKFDGFSILHGGHEEWTDPIKYDTSAQLHGEKIRNGAPAEFRTAIFMSHPVFTHILKGRYEIKHHL